MGARDVDVVSSLAGRVASPRMPAGQVRVGGFGGATGLASWMDAHGIRAVIDATHPFAAKISWNAAAAAAASHVPLLALRRAAWVPGEGDRWHEAASLEDAALMLPVLGRRHFLTIGRQGVSSFADVTDALVPGPLCRPARGAHAAADGAVARPGALFVGRRDRPDARSPGGHGHHQEQRGEATAAKLVGARELGLPVVMVQRPTTPGGVSEVSDVLGRDRVG